MNKALGPSLRRKCLQELHRARRDQLFSGVTGDGVHGKRRIEDYRVQIVPRIQRSSALYSHLSHCPGHFRAFPTTITSRDASYDKRRKFWLLASPLYCGSATRSLSGNRTGRFHHRRSFFRAGGAPAEFFLQTAWQALGITRRSWALNVIGQTTASHSRRSPSCRLFADGLNCNRRPHRGTFGSGTGELKAIDYRILC